MSKLTPEEKAARAAFISENRNLTVGEIVKLHNKRFPQENWTKGIVNDTIKNNPTLRRFRFGPIRENRRFGPRRRQEE